MRVLFSFVGGTGHAQPMVPVALALRAAGHTVAFAGHAATVAHLPFEALVTADSPPPPPSPLVDPDHEHELAVVRDFFAGRGPRNRVPRYLPVFRGWAPDLIVRDEMDFGAAIAADLIGVPGATVLVIASDAFVQPSSLEPLLEFRAELGLPAPGHGLVLSPFPPSLRADGTAFRTVVPAPRVTGARPRAYVTLGSVFPLESGDLFPRLLAGLSTLDVDVVVTTGRDLDPAALGPQPPHVRIAPWLSLDELLPTVDVVVHHGGSGTLTAAIAHGLPQVVLAMGADQMLNAGRIVSLGLGRALHPVTATPAEVAATVSSVLATPWPAVTRLQAEYAALPPPSALVPLLTELAQSQAVGHHEDG
jgi:UDP:flavonoid glycosyltransferase YjiC (YdhE family)